MLYINIIGFLAILLTSLVVIILLIRLFLFFSTQNRFPKKNLITALVGIILTSGLFFYNHYLFTFNHLKGEFYKGPVVSPTKMYSANAYFMPYGGAAGGVNLWVEITDHTEKDQTKIIYYSDAKSNFSMVWKDERTLSIINEEKDYPQSNRSIVLNVNEDIYHESGQACTSLLLKIKYKNCYQY
ncbi:hypothetical protein J2Z40_000155 [Cytobacillus eiseniae]|uniref:DUF5673 domain-containing protein n=1 Tax=Cytobacillus eiseniae TaxID=762947 RepID=A0ABS4R9N9_9BACI|nr:DUF5412 family protein [Cytobacillus eiseniae]MBP2239602.1 hypothetical protein [Cytobacillus eiseniae]